jgi:CRISPR/Cas system endoribonuclease Cas6 (RAMP superfamily)
MVREDGTGCCDNSKEPSDFVKGEKFLEWLIDCSLLKDIGPWSSCELLKEMRAKPVEYAATGSPRAVSSADKLLSATAELQRQQRRRRRRQRQIQQQQQQQQSVGNQLSHSRYKTRGLLY